MHGTCKTCSSLKVWSSPIGMQIAPSPTIGRCVLSPRTTCELSVLGKYLTKLCLSLQMCAEAPESTYQWSLLPFAVIKHTVMRTSDFSIAAYSSVHWANSTDGVGLSCFCAVFASGVGTLQGLPAFFLRQSRSQWLGMPHHLQVLLRLVEVAIVSLWSRIFLSPQGRRSQEWLPTVEY